MRSGLPALGGGESSGQIRMSTHLYSKRKVCNLIFLGYKLIIRGDICMAQSTLSIRINSEDKKGFETFCEQVGMNASVAVNMFVKTVIREQRLPFEVKADPFYSVANMERLERSVKQLKEGKGKAHELIEVED